MYIVSIAWLYVVVLMAATETSFAAGLATFVFYGALPLGIVLYLMDTPRRRRRRALAAQLEEPMPEEQPLRTGPAAAAAGAQGSSQISEAMRPLPASRRNE